MTYLELKDFLTARMRMSHVYQPVVIRALLEHGGSQSVKALASEILWRDKSQIEYYEAIVKKMVGRVLTTHGVVTRTGQDYKLNGVDDLTREQREELISLCDSKIATFEEKRGDTTWSHRAKSAGYISGTLRYEVLRKSAFHCELCGVSADKKALEVDHIVPRNLGGSDDPHNLQALCFSCNAMKRDRDSTDLRAVRESYGHKADGCLFCHLPPDRVIAENELALAIRDGFPVTPLHTLVIPKRHVATYFDLSQSELKACDKLLHETKAAIQAEDRMVGGFNIGMNSGEVAGQTVFHCHIHLIPRRRGDVENPRGGVRHLIPGKGHY
ncbi:MAG: HIT domain-containing protein [Hydrogenophaga sp.]|nr:HIT domain-containing protein [Hydrogenophaga sp.]